MKQLLIGLAALPVSLLMLVAGTASADTVSANFNSPGYTVGSINGQNGWMVTGVYDQGVVANGGTIPASFGNQSFRISDAVTSGSFGDQTFSMPLANQAGEATASSTAVIGTIQPHFEAQFDILPVAPGSGDIMSVSPDRGDGARMSYLRFEDMSDGIHVYFDDVTDPGHVTNGDTFNETEIATLINTVPHTIKFSMDFLPGPDNDVVKIYIDGTLVHTGTSWEDYYLYNTESNPGLADEQSRTVDKLLFRESETANPSDSGKGFLIDNLSLESGPIPTTSNTVVVTPSNMQGWEFVNDQTEGAGTGMMVTGPATPPLGTGSAQLTATSSTDGQILAEAAYPGTKLSSLTTLQYSTYQAASNPSNATAIALQFNVASDATNTADAYQGRIVYEPYNNNGGTVPLGSWNTWNALNGGNAKWWFSRPADFGGNCPQSSPCTLSQIIALYPNIAINPNPTLGAVVLKAGSGWTSFNGNADALTIGVDGNNTTYDFEPNAVVAAPFVITNPATGITASDATLNGTNGSMMAGGHSFWVSTSTFATSSPTIPTGVYSTPDMGAIAASTTFSATLSSITSDGVPGNLPPITPNTKYYFVAWSNVGGTWYPGAELNFTTGSTTAPSNVTVTIDKYIDGKMATAASAGSMAFPMSATWNATNIGSGTGTYTLSTTGYNSPNAYEAVTAQMTSGASYMTNEVTTGNAVVGASCAAGDPYALVGYSWGNSTSSAAAMMATTTVPSFTNLMQNEYVIVWNQNCLPAPTLLTPPNGTSTTTAGLTGTSWSAVTDPVGGITYVYQSSNASTTNPNGSFTTPAFTSGPLSTTTEPTPGTPAGMYWWHVQATDADGNMSPWSTIWTFTVNNTVASSTPPANACNTPSVAPAGYTLKNGTPGNDSVTLVPMTMFVGTAGNDKVSGPAGSYIVCLGNGNSTVNLGTGNDTISTGNGNQVIMAGAGNDAIMTGNGNETVTVGTGSGTITTGNGNSTITTGAGSSYHIMTGNGNGTINGGTSSTDTCSLGNGRNTVHSCTL